MTPISRTPNARPNLTRDEILRVSADLFRKKGYRGTSLQEVADHFGVRRPAIYYWFKSKSDILLEIHQRFMEMSTAQLNEILEMDIDPHERLVRIMSGRIDMFSSNMADLAVYIENESELPESALVQVREVKKSYLRTVEQIYREGVEKGVFVDVDPHIAASIILGMTLWMYKWYRPGGRHSVEDVTSAIINFACHGYLKPDNLPAGLSLTPASAEAGGEAEGIGHGSGRPQR